MPHEFTGFGPALRFLKALTENNEREWFEANRLRYEEDVREPARVFVRAMQPLLRKISPAFVADDRKVGGSIMRVNKDVRFAKDKTPYKTNLGIQFRHRTGKDVHAPGMYVHVEPGNLFLGSGMWHPEPDALHTLRHAIASSLPKWRAALGDPKLTEFWTPGGESLKRAPKDFVADHPAIDDIKRTDFILGTPLTVAEVESPKFVELAASRFMASRPYLKFQCAALKLDC
ncbi:MAG: DUF2461 domain-containing protein [Vicinamibacteria bacterium]